MPLDRNHLHWLAIRDGLLRAVLAIDSILGPPPAVAVGVDEAGEHQRIETRVSQFMASSSNPDMPDESYPIAQQRQCGRFRDFTSRRRPGMAWQRAHPVDILAYLVSLDSTSRTIVHDQASCPNAGATNLDKPFGDCDCPRRAKATSLSTSVAHLQADFSRYVSATTWHESLSVGNPCMSTVVTKYIDHMSATQTRAGLRVKQAAMLTLDELRRLMLDLSTSANDANACTYARLQAFADACAITWQLASGARMGDLLASIRFRAVRLSALSIGFRQTWGKTIRGIGKARDFDLAVHSEPLLCPARRFCEFTLALRACGIDTDDASFVFRRIDRQARSVGPTADTYTAMDFRFRRRLDDLGILSGHHLHGVRALHVVEAQLRDLHTASVAVFVGWARESMPQHYGRMSQTLGALAPFLDLVSTKITDKREYARRMALPLELCNPSMSRQTYELIAAERHFVPI